MSAREAKNGFVRNENCFVEKPTTKQFGQKCEYFQGAENRKISEPESSRFRTKTALERALELALGVVWCADPAQRFKRDERPCANVVAGQAFSPAGENRYPPPRMVRMTAGLVGSGSILRRMRMILRSTARSKASASRAFASSNSRSRESTRF